MATDGLEPAGPFVPEGIGGAGRNQTSHYARKVVEETLRRLPVFLRCKYDRAPGAAELAYKALFLTLFGERRLLLSF